MMSMFVFFISNVQLNFPSTSYATVNAELLKTGDFQLLELADDAKERLVEMQLPYIHKIMEK